MRLLSSFGPLFAAESMSMIIEFHAEELALISTGHTQSPSEQPQDDQKEGQDNYGTAFDTAHKEHVHEHRVKVGMETQFPGRDKSSLP